MAQPSSPSKHTIQALIYLLAGALFLAAGFNILGATPGPHWLYFGLAAIFVAAGVWRLIR
jgi:hypothetical protein